MDLPLGGFCSGKRRGTHGSRQAVKVPLEQSFRGWTVKWLQGANPNIEVSHHELQESHCEGW